MTLSVGRTLAGHSYVDEGTKIAPGVMIGKYCSIARLCTIGAEHHDYTRFTTSMFSEESRTRIGHDVWIGCNSVIMSGVNVGTGAVIGAGSVVTRDVTPYSITFGAPAIMRNLRFRISVIEALLESKWWELPHETIKTFSPDPLIMLEECRKVREGTHDRIDA